MPRAKNKKSRTGHLGVDVDSIDSGKLDAQVGYRLRRAYVWSRQYFKELLGPEGIAPGQYSIFYLICNNEGINQKAIASIRKVDQSTIVPTLHHLEDKGWIRRVRQPPDRRVAALIPTAAGRRKLAKLEKMVDQHEQALTSELSDAEIDQLLSLLKRISELPLARPRRTGK